MNKLWLMQCYRYWENNGDSLLERRLISSELWRVFSRGNALLNNDQAHIVQELSSFDAEEEWGCMLAMELPRKTSDTQPL